ncbi:MAG: SPASM domain-containing protein [Vulcanimicrobiota bacterium]
MLKDYDYHIFSREQDHILALANGQAFLVDELSKDIIETSSDSQEKVFEILKEKHSRENIREAFAEWQKLKKGIIIKDHQKDTPPRNLRALCLNITHKCNLACSYCFAERLTEENAPSMTVETVCKSLDFLFENSHDVHRLQVDFFGGEPLLVFDKVKAGVEYARKLEQKLDKEILFSLTTNATLLTDEIIDFVKKHNISLILSLDGDKTVNDLHRKYRNGKGSFDEIIKNILKVKEKLHPMDYYIRGTFTARSLNLKETADFFHRMGFYNISLEPVTGPDTYEFSLKKEHLGNLHEEYIKLANWMKDKNIQFYHFNMELENPLCLTRRITGCGAGVEYVVVDPRGDIYPCHQFVENEEFLLGNIFHGINNHKLCSTFRESTIYQKEDCPRCWARFYCSGGCHFQHYVRTGSINKPWGGYCQMFRDRLETSLWYNIRRNSNINGESKISKK